MINVLIILTVCFLLAVIVPWQWWVWTLALLLGTGLALAAAAVVYVAWVKWVKEDEP